MTSPTDFNKKLISLDYLLRLVHSDDLNKLVHPIDAVLNKANKIQKVLKSTFQELIDQL